MRWRFLFLLNTIKESELSPVEISATGEPTVKFKVKT